MTRQRTEPKTMVGVYLTNDDLGFLYQLEASNKIPSVSKFIRNVVQHLKKDKRLLTEVLDEQNV